MYLIAQDYRNHSKYNFLLFLSLSIIIFSFYYLFKNSTYITIAPTPVVVVEKKIISISMIVPEPVIKKSAQRLKKKIIKKVIKKKTVTKTIKKVVPIKKELAKVVEPKIEQVVKRVVEKQVIPKPIVPTINAKMKTSFIAGLYEALNEKKHYPKMAKRRKLEGIVTISFTLCKNGTIKNIFINNSCGHKILDRAALKVVKSVDIYKAIPDAVSLTALNLNIPIKYSRG